MKTFQVRIVAHDGVVLEQQASALHLKGVDGRFTVLADHAALVSRLAVGAVLVDKADGQQEEISISGGFIRVDRNKAVLNITR